MDTTMSTGTPTVGDGPAAGAAAGSTPAAVPLRALGYSGGVTLTGRLGERIADAAATYGGMSVDSVLKGFRRRAGIPAPGVDLTGWSSDSSEPTFGQWVSGLARLSAVLGDATLAQHAADLVDGYAKTLPANHRTGMGTYGWEKLVCGLVDAAQFAGHGEALEVLSAVVRADQFDLTRAPATANDFSGDGPGGTLEWYTLSENLYRGYQLTGDPALREAAQTWHYDAYWSRFLQAPLPGDRWDIPAWLHAYSHVNTFASVAAAYAVDRDPDHLTILRNAYDWLDQTQTFATGGFGPCEFTMPEDGTLGQSLEWRSESAEIVCGTWAAFKLCSALLTETGEARYADWVERLVYNGIGATTPVQPGGRTPYYADYRLGVATKLPYWHDWPCCSGTYVQAVAHLSDLVYFATPTGLATALYVPSQVTWDHDGDRVTLTQQTDFPRTDHSRFQVTAPRPVELELRFRVPGWTTAMTVHVNGRSSVTRCVPGTWVAVQRTWTSTDVVTIDFGATLRAEPVDAFHPNRVAMAFGPVVLAQDLDWVAPFTAPVPWAMLDWDSHLVREGADLLFRPAGAGTHRMQPGLFRPFYDVPERLPYRLYHDLDRFRLV